MQHRAAGRLMIITSSTCLFGCGVTSTFSIIVITWYVETSNGKSSE